MPPRPTPAGTPRRQPAKKAAAKKAASKKTASKKAATKKAATKKAASKKAATKKAATKKAASKKAATRKTASKKATTKKAASKKTAAKKTAAKKTAAKKTTAKKTTAKKTAARTSAAGEGSASDQARGLAAVPQLDAPPPAELVTRARAIHQRLGRAQPNPEVELDHQDAWQLLVATILAARSNDRIINSLTPTLFARWPTPAALAAASPAQVEGVIKKSGFFRQKTRAIMSTARMVVERFGGEVPTTMEQLVTLPGVARKTANVVLGSGFGTHAGIIVDLHVTRLVERLGMTSDKDARRIEALLCALFPRPAWAAVGHRLVLHGRHVCTARKPRCARCPLNELCPSAADEPAGRWTERARWEQSRTESRGQLDPAEA